MVMPGTPDWKGQVPFCQSRIVSADGEAFIKTKGAWRLKLFPWGKHQYRILALGLCRCTNICKAIRDIHTQRRVIPTVSLYKLNLKIKPAYSIWLLQKKLDRRRLSKNGLIISLFGFGVGFFRERWMSGSQEQVPSLGMLCYSIQTIWILAKPHKKKALTWTSKEEWVLCYRLTFPIKLSCIFFPKAKRS